jgi:hypothetical protein
MVSSLKRNVLRFTASLILLAALAPFAFATPSFNSLAPWNAVTTYESIGLYWKPSAGADGTKATVRFREQGQSTWREGHELWWDTRNDEYRGSLVELNHNTVYEIQLRVGTGTWTDTSASCDVAANSNCVIPATTSCSSANRTQCTRTWNNDYLVKEVRPVTSRTTQLTITEGGNETEGYIVYEGVDGNNTITLTDGSNQHCVQVDADFVVVRNLVMQGCGIDGVRLHSNHFAPNRRAANDVIVEDNEIKGWGRVRSGGFALDRDSGIRCENWHETNNGDDDVNGRSNRIVIQRNKIHSPRYSSNPWRTSASSGSSHPAGAQAATFNRCGTNHVIRWNDVYSENGNFFNDGFGGAENFGEDPGSGGFPWADSDIYGNRITHVYDDAIEAEGDNRNVRIWANYFDHVMVGIGAAATAKGPLYVWRNVSNWMANMNCTGCDSDTDDPRGELVKGGGKPTAYNGGIAYYYHNTLLQQPAAGKQFPMGSGEGLAGTETLYNFVSRANIWHIHKITDNPGLPDFWSLHADCSSGPCTPPTPDNGPAADYDLFNGRIMNAGPNPEQNAVALGWGALGGNASKVPTYLAGGTSYPTAIPSDANGWTGDFRLAAGTLGTSSVPWLPNFNDPDPALRHVGAQPPNKSEMKFGRAAATDEGGGGDPGGGGGNAPAFRSAAAASYGPAIGFRAAASAATNGSSLAIGKPAGTAANDVMIASISARPSSATIAAPAGWVLVRRIDNASGQTTSLAVFRKVAGAGEPASYTWDVTGATWAVGGIQSFVNVDAVNPIDVEAGQATPGGFTHATPSVTTTVANAIVVTSHTFATSETWTPPTGMTEAFDVQFQPVTTNQGQSLEGNYVVQAAAGATGTKTATAAGGAGAEDIGAAHILALRPGAAVLGIEKPAGTAENDVMIASISARPSSATIAAPTGWTLVRRIDNVSGQTISLAVFRKVAGAGEPASYIWGVSGATWAVGGIQSFSNVDTTNPVDVENGQATSSGFTHATPSVTTTVANAMVVTSHTFATSTTWTPPAGMTEAFDAQFQPTAPNTGSSIEGNYVVQAAAGATGTKTATAAGGSGAEDHGATHILGLRPAAP